MRLLDESDGVLGVLLGSRIWATSAVPELFCCCKLRSHFRILARPSS